MAKQITLRDAFKYYLKQIGSTPSSERTSDALNRYLPERMQITRQSTSNWMRTGSADDGVFYALLWHAPSTSPEYKFAFDVLAAVGNIEPMVEVVSS